MPGSTLVYTVGEGEGGVNWESSVEIYTLTYAKQIASGKLLCNKGSPVLCDNLQMWDGVWVERMIGREGIYCILTADSRYCTAENDTTLWSSYPPTKNKFKKKKLGFGGGSWEVPGSEPGTESAAVSKAYMVSALRQLASWWECSLYHPFIIIIIIYFLLKDNCFTEFCCVLSNLSMNQP